MNLIKFAMKYFSFNLLFTDPIYTSFHDEEWGVQVHEDKKLFEMLVFSQALAELSWPAILNKRDIFRYTITYLITSVFLTILRSTF